MDENDLPQRVAVVRRFNRFYTKQIGVLHEGLLGSRFSLTEVRVLYELAHRDRPTAAELSKELDLDPGYLSRILRGFELQGFLERRPSETDGRQSHLSLTDQGREVFAPLNAGSDAEVAALLGRLSPAQQDLLVQAMTEIEGLLGDRPKDSRPYLLRPHQPGDMGLVTHLHGRLYAQEYGWDETFEALVAGIVAKFINHFDPQRERCWIAEREGQIVGSVFLVRKSKTVAKLRLLIVDPKARGLGLGRRLVEECLRFARQAGYRKVVLWTQSNLGAARLIYERAGFRLIHQEPHHSFGHDLVAETWELKLPPAPR